MILNFLGTCIAKGLYSHRSSGTELATKMWEDRLQSGLNLPNQKLLRSFTKRGKMMDLMSSKGHLVLEAMIHLYNEFLSLTETMPKLKDMIPTLDSDICPLLSDHYNVNIIIHQPRPFDQIVYRHPAIYNHSWPDVDLYRKLSLDGNSAHVDSLISPMRYHYKQGGKTLLPVLF